MQSMTDNEPMISIRRVEDDEVTLARELHNRFTAQERSMASVRSWYEEVPGLFLFAVDNDAVVGVCTGRPRGERDASLAGIELDSSNDSRTTPVRPASSG